MINTDAIPGCRAGDIDFTLEDAPTAWDISLTARELAPGRFELLLSAEAAEAAAPPALRLRWRLPARDALAIWRPGRGQSHHLPPDWTSEKKPLRASACSNAPLLCLHGLDGVNRMCVACSNALHPSELACGVHEESGDYRCSMVPFPGYRIPAQRFEQRLLVDLRSLPMVEVLADASAWWAAQPGYEPAPVPACGKRAMYSTWYSMHQNLSSDGIVEQCRLAKELGCEAVIVDDGWQTNDSGRGYAFTGDWLPERLSDISEMVERVHALDMQVLLWFAVPFVGKEHKAWDRFQGKLLKNWPGNAFNVLDPRYPDVREYLISVWERALRDWDLDGLKLDFVDHFVGQDWEPDDAAPGRDIACVYEAADRLLADAMDRLRAIKPEVMIEFRQSYIGPKMRRYGNLFRAGDCPLDAISNRVRCSDIRLIAGDTAVHADMLMWHPEDPVANAALQLLAVLFFVPQISVDLNRIPEDHQRMLRFWMDFWNEHRSTLLDGHFLPRHQELLYPQLASRDQDCCCVASYADGLIVVDEAPPAELQLINATRGSRLILDAPAAGDYRCEIRDCQGALCETLQLSLDGRPLTLPVPAAGLASLRAT